MVEASAVAKALAKLEAKRTELVQFVRELVRIPSVAPSAHEGEAQEVVRERLQRIEALHVEVWEPTLDEVERYPLHPIRLTPWSYRSRPNVVGILRGMGGGRSLLLNGHIDVVSPEPLDNWRHDPWAAQVEGNRLYGRGAVDMKAGLAAMVVAIECITEAGLKLRGSLTLQSVVEEEAGGGGTVAAVVRGYQTDAAIVGEPTGSENVCIGSGGSRFFRIRVSGQAGMPQIAHQSVSAIEPAVKIYRGLIALAEQRAKRMKGRHPLFEVQVESPLSGAGRATSLNVGVLRAGNWAATVPGWGELEGRVGFPPSEPGEEVMAEFEEAIMASGRKDPWMVLHEPRLTWWGARREGYELSVDDPLAQTVRRNVERVTGKPCTFFASPAATDAAYLTPRVDGFGGRPSIVYGPTGGGAHAADEFVDLDDMLRVTRVLVLSILDWCGFEAR